MDAREAERILQGPHYSPYPKPVQRRIDYAGTDNPVYIGFALAGYADSEARWYVEKLEYDASDRYVKSTHSPINSIWDNRAALTYS